MSQVRCQPNTSLSALYTPGTTNQCGSLVRFLQSRLQNRLEASALTANAAVATCGKAAGEVQGLGFSTLSRGARVWAFMGSFIRLL